MELLTLLKSQVIPAIEMYQRHTPVRVKTFINDGEGLNMFVSALGKDTLLPPTLWEWNDHMMHVAMPERAKRIVEAVGVTQEAMWCLILAYAMYDGLRDYAAYHKTLPVDNAAYLYAMLTANDLKSVTRKQF